MTTTPRVTFLLDVDNTLLDNDAAKVEIDRVLRGLLGEEETARFWRCYEEVRAIDGVVSFPLTLERFWTVAPKAPGTGWDRERLRDDVSDALLAFPYQRFVYRGSLPGIAHVAAFGRPVIFSDGDPTFQPSKIIRSGLGAAVAGYVLVYPHKAEHLAEIEASFPADRFVLVDDNPNIISAVRRRMRAPLTTIFVQQGKYAQVVGPGPWSGADITLTSIDELQRLDRHSFIDPGGQPHGSTDGGLAGSA